MGAKIMDWIATHKTAVVSFVIGMIVGGVVFRLGGM